MWFFKKNTPEPSEEEFTLNNLTPLLKKLLDESLSDFYSTSDDYVSLFNDSKKGFIEECKVLEKHTGEPNVEDMWAPNINSIKTQKNSYTKTLMRVLEKEYEGSFDTKYGKYKAELSIMGDTIGEMLRINSMFKVVVLSYSNELTQFKKIFANMERARDKLQLSITDIQPKYKKYEEIRNKIENLYGMIEESNLMDSNVSSINSELSTLSAKNDSSLHEKLKTLLTEKNQELSSAKEKIHNMKVKISSSLMQLERAARKMDYSYKGKRSLVSFIENPEENFNDESDYKDFEKLLDDMVSLLNMDKIQIKGKEAIFPIIQKLKTSEFRDQIKQLSELNEQKKFLFDEINNLENEVLSKESKSKIIQEKEKEKQQMFLRKEQLKQLTTSTKSELIELFLKYYNRKIKVIGE